MEKDTREAFSALVAALAPLILLGLTVLCTIAMLMRDACCSSESQYPIMEPQDEDPMPVPPPDKKLEAPRSMMPTLGGRGAEPAQRLHCAQCGRAGRERIFQNATGHVLRVYVVMEPYRVARDDTLWKLARRFGVPYEAIAEENAAILYENWLRHCLGRESRGPAKFCDTPEATLHTGMELYIPTVALVRSVAPQPEDAGAVY